MEGIKLTQEAEQTQAQATDLATQAGNVRVIDSQTYVAAGEWWTRIKLLREKVDETFSPLIKSAWTTHKLILGKKNEIDAPLEASQRRIKGLMEEYDRDQQAKARKEEQRIAEEARKAQEERVLEAAVQAEKSGDKALAQTIIETPVHTPAVVIPRDVPKLEGGPVFREVWQFEIERADLIPRAYLIPDEIKIGKVVRAMKDQANIPGIKVFSKRV
jgi:hypothetical protein